MSATNGAHAEVRLPQGTVRYRDSGSGEPIVFIHGLLVSGGLWRKVTPPLEGEHRCIVPELPLGSHRIPMAAEADLSPPGVARLVADFLEALELDGVTLVGNDTGGAISQLVAAHHPERLGRLVLTPCDAYENFLPPAFRPLQYGAHVPGLITALVQGARIGAIRRSPLGFGMLIKSRPMDDEALRGYLAPFLADRGVRRDALKVLRGISSRQTIEAAERLRDFDRPTLIAWAPEDRFFKLRFAERLANDIPNARLIRIEDSLTFVPEDQPDRLAEAIAEFMKETRESTGAASAT
ncbi:MAG TPA: alpha/beta fold hydrolase [Solirubrobacterales bacterium]